MRPVDIPNELTYVGVFLTLRCNYKCSYCINRHGKLSRRRELTPEQWIEGLNRLNIPRSLMVPLTLQGGEPSVYKEWLDIIEGVRPEFYIDILTNLTFDLDDFIKRILPGRLQRNVPYASIRVSYHPEWADYDVLLRRILALQGAGYDIGLFVVDHPNIDIEIPKRTALLAGVDFRTKQFLGEYDGKLYGTYKYPESVSGYKNKIVDCKLTELLIAPNGNIHHCHRDLYANENVLGNILDPELRISFEYRKCKNFGLCNNCDQKIKTDRYQRWGVSSASVRFNGVLDEDGTVQRPKSGL